MVLDFLREEFDTAMAMAGKIHRRGTLTRILNYAGDACVISRQTQTCVISVYM